MSPFTEIDETGNERVWVPSEQWLTVLRPASPIDQRVDYAKDLLTDHKADQPTNIASRRATCRTCRHYRSGTDTCGLCGCGAVIAQRAASPLGKCPAGLWPADT